MKNLPLASTSKTILCAASIGLAFAVLLAAATQPAQAQTYTVLYAFKGVPDGANPAAGLLRDAKGNLYGTTQYGGYVSSSFCSIVGCGVVFKIDAAGKETVLYRFNDEHGTNPMAGLVGNAEGNLYGTTVSGGRFGLGTAFLVTPTGKQTVIHNFKNGTGGSYPQARLARDSSGNLYGTTSVGGNSTNSGVLFKLNEFGREAVLYTFSCYSCYGHDGGGFGLPEARAIRDSAGNFYGLANGGSVSNQCNVVGCGVVYKVDRNGVGTILYNFAGGTDGYWGPWGKLIMDADGNLYGTTGYGGRGGCDKDFGGCGIVFKVDPKGNETVLYRFTGGADGGFPSGGLTRDSQGNLYGTTRVGGNVNLPACYDDFSGNGCGVVFKLDPNGTETTLYAFTGGTDGGGPNSDLIRDPAGNLYGTTSYGGDISSPLCPKGCGVVFKITP